MSVTSPVNRTDTFGTGAVSVFQFPYVFLQNADLVVWLTDYTTVATGVATLLTYGTDYTVSGAGNPLGGSITLLGAPTSTILPAAPTSQQKISIIRAPALTQELILPGSGPLNVASLVTELDSLEMQIQALNEILGRTPSLPITQAAGITPTLPLPSPGSVLGWNAAGTALQNWVQDSVAGSGAALQALLASTIAGQGDALIGVLQPGAGAVGTTQDVINARFVCPEEYGAAGDGVTDDTVAIQKWAACGVKNKFLPARTYKIISTITFEEGAFVRGCGLDSVIDASAAGASFNGSVASSAVLTATQGTLTALPALSVTKVAGDTLLTFASAHGLSVGDVVCIYNPTAGSFVTSPNNGHTYYAGEFGRVATVNSPTTVTLWTPLYCTGSAASYTAGNCTVYKLSQATIALQNFRVKSPQANYDPGIYIRQCTGVRVEDVQCDNNDYGGFLFMGCYDLVVRGLNSRCEAAPSGYQYGIIITSCQNVEVGQCNTYTTRHGITVSAAIGLLCGVPSRAVTVHDSEFNSGVGLVGGVDCHAGAEDVLFDSCRIYNGVNLGGKDINFKNCKIFNGNATGDAGYAYSGSCVEIDELVGGLYTFEHCDFSTLGNPLANSHGVIDLGGNGGSIISSLIGPVDIHIRNCTVRAPNNATGGAFLWAANRGSTFPVNVLVDGLVLLGSTSMTRVVRYEIDTATSFTGSINASLQLVLGTVPTPSGNNAFAVGQGLAGAGVPAGVVIGAYQSGGSGPGTVGAIYALSAPAGVTIVQVSSEAMTSTGNPIASYLIVDNITGTWPLPSQLMAYSGAPTTNPMRMMRQTQRQTISTTAANPNLGATWFFPFTYPKAPTVQVQRGGVGNAAAVGLGAVPIAYNQQCDLNYAIPGILSAGGTNFSAGAQCDLHTYVEICDF